VFAQQISSCGRSGRGSLGDSPGIDSSTPLLWAIREQLGLTGTKYGCGMALCGACTVHVEGKAVRSCVTPVSAIANKHVTTIEGLAPDRSHPVQRAWLQVQVPQCGYCQCGQMMSAAALLAVNTQPPIPISTTPWRETIA